jgi:DNA-binding MarR family transcriptional regulator
VTDERSLEGSRYDAAEASPGYLFWRASSAWTRLLRAELDKHDLTQAQYAVLAATAYLGGQADAVSQQDVATHLGMDKMQVSDVAATLERRKLLVRKPHPGDGRARALGLTAAARKRLAAVVPAVEAADERFFAPLQGQERASFAAALAKLG